MNQPFIYVVQSYGDCHENTSYDQDWERNLLATHDLNKAEEFVQERQKKKIEYNSILDILEKKLMQWHEKNPRPEHAPLEKYPRWGHGVRMDQITVEMRAERDAIKARNALVLQQCQNIDKEYTNREDEEEHRILNELGIPEDKHADYMGYHEQQEQHYRIVTVPYV